MNIYFFRFFIIFQIFVWCEALRSQFFVENNYNMIQLTTTIVKTISQFFSFYISMITDLISILKHIQEFFIVWINALSQFIDINSSFCVLSQINVNRLFFIFLHFVFRSRIVFAFNFAFDFFIHFNTNFNFLIRSLSNERKSQSSNLKSVIFL